MQIKIYIYKIYTAHYLSIYIYYINGLLDYGKNDHDYFCQLYNKIYFLLLFLETSRI